MSKRQDARKGIASVITGASAGIGREIAIKLSERGHVILCGRHVDRLDTTKNLCKDPANTTIIAGDLGTMDVRNKLLAMADLYTVQTLVLAAGVYSKEPVAAQYNPEVLLMNVQTNIRLIYRFLPVLSTFGGQIVHLNSVAGKQASPDEPLYSASKHAMAGFLRAARPELRAKGVRVLDVFLGASQTEMMAHRADMEKLMRPSEIAEAVVANLGTPLSLQIEELHIGRMMV